MKYGLTGKIKAKEGKGKELLAILADASKLVSTAKGCCIYIVFREIDSEDSIWVTEVWETEKDHDDSLFLPGCKELIAQAIPLIEGKLEGTRLYALAGKGL